MQHKKNLQRSLLAVGIAALMVMNVSGVSADEDDALPPLPVSVAAMAADPLGLPPLEVEDTVPWVWVTFVGSDPVTVNPLDLAGYQVNNAPDPKDSLNTLKASLDNPFLLVNSAEEDVEQEAEQTLFDLHITDWPGGLSAEKVALLIQDESLPEAQMLVLEVDESMEDGAIFTEVPLLAGGAYWFYVDSANFGLDLFQETLGSLNVQASEEDVQSQASAAPSCQTTWNNGWDNYGRDWLGKNDEDTLFNGWDDLSQAAWKYHWTIGDTCGYSGTDHIRAAVGYGWAGQSKIPQGGYHASVFGAQWWGDKDVDCYRVSGYRHQVCEGHRFSIAKTHYHYRTPQAPGAKHQDADYLGFPSSSCSKTLPPGAKEALTTVAFVYPWAGLAGYLPDEVCKTKWSKTSKGPDGSAGLGAKLKEKGVSDGSLQKVTGVVLTSYPTKTIDTFKMELVGGVKYTVWANACGSTCNDISLNRQTHWSTEPMAQVV